MTKLSVTVEADVLAEIKRLKGDGVNVSFLVNDALRRESKRLQMLELLEEMQREEPISSEERAKGQQRWNELLSSTPVPSPVSRDKKRRRG